MRVYEVPYYFEHEEKVFGGYISLRQAIYLMITIIAIGLFFLDFIDVTLKVILFFAIAGVCSILAFVKIDGTNADKYLLYILKFLFKKKIYVLER